MKCRRNLLGEMSEQVVGGEGTKQTKVMWEWECGSGSDYRALFNRTASQWHIKPSQKSPQYRQGVGVTIGHYPIEQHPNGHIKPSQKILYKKERSERPG